MEHRYSNRINAEFQICLYSRDEAISTGVTRNLSRDGLFVALESCEVRKHQPLRLEIVDGSLKQLSFGVIVTRLGHDGVGLEFSEKYLEIEQLIAGLPGT